MIKTSHIIMYLISISSVVWYADKTIDENFDITWVEKDPELRYSDVGFRCIKIEK